MSDKLGDFEDVPHDDSDDDHRLADAEPDNRNTTDAEPATQPDDAPRDRDDPVLDDEQPDTERRHNVNESHDKIRIETDLTRGTGTRDQEKHKLKARGETPEEAAANLSETLRELEERDVFERMREVEQ